MGVFIDFPGDLEASPPKARRYGDAALAAAVRRLGPEPGDPAASVLDELATEWRLDLTSVVLRGRVLEIAVSGYPSIILDGARVALSPRLVRDAVFDATGRVVRMTSAEDWGRRVERLRALARLAHVESEEDETRAWILDHGLSTLHYDVLAFDNRESRILLYSRGGHAAAWRESDEIVVHLDRLLHRVHDAGMRNVTRAALSARLGRVGLRREHRGFRHGGELVRARLWVGEFSDFLADAEGHPSEAEIVQADGEE